MKKLFVFAILTIFAISTLHSQWLEKEGYWELSEKIPDLRDLKILPEENLIITVSKDNTIRHIEYDSGKILKSGKPAGLPDSNDYAKISSDGKTTVFANYKNGSSFTDIKVTIIENNNLLKLCYALLNNSFQNGNYSFKRIEDITISFSDFNNNMQELIISVCRSGKGQEGGGKVQSSFKDGNVFFSKKNGDSLIIIKQYEKFSPIDFKKLSNSNSKLMMIGYNSSSWYASSMSNYTIENILSLINSNLDTAILFQSKYQKNEPSGPWTEGEIGYFFPMNQVFESFRPNLWKIRSDGKLFTYDLDGKKFVDSISNNIYKKDIIVFNNGRLTGQIDSTFYNIYNSFNSKLLSTSILPEKVLIPNPIIDEKNNRTIFALESGKVIYQKSNVLEQFPNEIIALSKDIAYVGETIEIASLDNSINADYKWEIDNEVIMSTKERNFQYKFDTAGVYDIKLTITLPNSTTHKFTKLQAIKVNDSLKADFEILIQNSELPLRVNFGNKSKGNIKKMFWDFGDGQTVEGFNPEHTYRFKGDFSPMLIISDDNYSDTIIKYELIKTHTEIIDDGVPEKTNRINSKQKALRNAFLMENGINVNFSYEYNIPTGFQDYKDYYSEITTLIYDVNLNDDKVDTAKFSYWHPYSDPFYTKSIYKLENDKFAVLYSRINMDFLIFNVILKKSTFVKPSSIPYWESVHGNADKTIFWVINQKDSAAVIKTDSEYKTLSKLSIPPNAKQYLADTLDNGLNLIVKEQNNSYSYISISSGNKINTEKSFMLSTDITLSGIKSVNENLILLHGNYYDNANRVTYAYFGKYHPLDNTLKDTILYSRKDIRKIERVSNSLYAAIGQSRGRQGYLLLDTNLRQIKDIRVDSLTGEIKDMIFHDKKVYLFTEKIVSLPTMALGAKESYQTTASVLGLPEDILLSVGDSPIIFTDKLKHSAYPNPTSEVLNLKVAVSESANYTIKLYDIFGTEILNIHDGFIPANTEKIFSILTSALSIGSYYYVISGGGIVERGKVMVVR